MLDLADIQGYEFLKPLVTGWLSKIEGALSCGPRKRWKEVSDECQMFYSKSAAAMWDPLYAKKFWRGIKAPKTRVSINKAFEFVAVYGPNLIWDIPNRQVTAKKMLELPPEAFPDQQLYQAIQQANVSDAAQDKLVSHLMQTWLNYTPREMPNGGLEHHNEMAVLDAMLKGQGCLWPAPYSFPSSQMTLTGCFRKPPEDLIVDPDFKTMGEATWIALRHIEPYWKVEKRFKLPHRSLKDKSSMESSWHYAELASRESEGQMTGERKSGKTNDLVVWYEVWSKLGTGARMTGMPDSIKNHLEESVGDYAYLAICPDCPYPLNCPADRIRNGASTAEIVNCFEWPVPLWTDDRWPVEQLKFYEDPDSAYGIPPLAPALGELKAMNAIVSWLVSRTWQSSRQMWAVLAQYHDDMKKQLEEGDDLSVFAIPPGSDQDIRKIVQLIEGKEVNNDSWQVYELLSNAFDKRMGMTPFVYGQNEDGTQDRTAETTSARKAAVSARPEYMQKKVVAWQSRVASVEAMLTWLFVKANDVLPLMGQAGAALWKQHIENADHELVMRQMRYEIAAASIRRPNRDRDIANLQEIGARLLPLYQAYGELSGNYEPVNGFVRSWGEKHDMEVEGLLIPAKDENDPNAQLDQQLKQAEVAKTMAEAKKAEAEAQANPMVELQMEHEHETQKLALDAQAQEREMQLDLAKTQAEIQMEIKKLEAELAIKKQELAMKAQEHQMEMQFKQQESQLDLAVKKEQGAQQVAQGNQQLRHTEQSHQQQMQQQKQAGTQKVQVTKQQSDAKTAAIRQQAKAKSATKPNKAA